MCRQAGEASAAKKAQDDAAAALQELEDSHKQEGFDAEIKSTKLKISAKLRKLQGLKKDLETYEFSLSSLRHASISDTLQPPSDDNREDQNVEPGDTDVLQACIANTQGVIDDTNQELFALTELLGKLSAPKSLLQPSAAEPHVYVEEEDSKVRWRITGSLIFNACKQSQDFVESVFCTLHRFICSRIAKNLDCEASELHGSEATFSEKELLSSYEDFHSFRQMFALSVIECHISFARATQSNPIKMCHVNDAEDFKQFITAARNVRIAWHNSQPKYWSHQVFGPFEMAKLYCRQFGSSDPPLGFRSLDPSSLFRLLARCTFFSQIIDSRQLLRERTVKGLLWSYKSWSSALSTRQLDAETFGRIRSLLSVFIQEVGTAKLDCSSFLQPVNVSKYFELCVDSSGRTGFSSSISESVGRGQRFDGLDGSDCDSTSDMSESIGESRIGVDGGNGLTTADKLTAARAAAALPLCVSDTEFALIKLREAFVAAQVRRSVISCNSAVCTDHTSQPIASAAAAELFQKKFPRQPPHQPGADPEWFVQMKREVPRMLQAHMKLNEAWNM